MNQMTIGAKSLTPGEGGLAAFFALLAFLSIIGAAKAEDVRFAFHAYLAAAASLAAAFAIINRYYPRPAALLPPQEIDGKPNYNMGPVKFATVAAMFWGTTFGRLRPLHTSAVIFALGGNVMLATSFYVVQSQSPAWRRRWPRRSPCRAHPCW
jgi:cytochrome c oxidase cbb3-type subunit 1